ncbi:MarR family winged helix-turn-helix transcriptional regulator [Streptomyces sp. NPDC002668]|uniref:MarR family winged helix-turn-helix transcriptional regulator n=1 Tax=Streptomyces sp. NPDC002668 TaxID=3154422 RepID=UPI0033258F7C
MPVALQDLGLAVKRLQHRHHRTLDALLGEQGTTLVQWDALRAIHRHPDSTSHELALLTFQSDQSFGTLAKRLLALGLIERTAGPGRAIRHRLNPAGEAVLDNGRAVVDRVLAESFAPLSPQERDLLHSLLMRLLPEQGGRDTDEHQAPTR